MEAERTMAVPSYKEARRIIQLLSPEDRTRLIQEMSLTGVSHSESGEPASILEFCGLGQEIWDGIDAQQYVSRERSSWNG